MKSEKMTIKYDSNLGWKILGVILLSNFISFIEICNYAAPGGCLGGLLLILIWIPLIIFLILMTGVISIILKILYKFIPILHRININTLLLFIAVIITIITNIYVYI